MRKMTRALEKSLLFTQRYCADKQSLKEMFNNNKDNEQFYKDLHNLVGELYNENIKNKETKKK